MNNLKTKILETVKNNNIRMIPKWKFVLYSTLGVVSILFAFLIVVFIMSLTLFVLSKNGFMDMPFFGFMHTLHALSAIPLVLLLCTIVLLILIELISRHYSFTFRRPLAVTLLLITSVTTVISFVISQTPIHEYIRDYMKSNHFDMMSKAYDRPMLPRADGMDVIRGEVIITSATSATLELFDGSTITAYATTSGGTTTMPRAPGVGDDVVMIGTMIGDRFEIIRIRPAHRMPFDTSTSRRGHHMDIINPMNTNTTHGHASSTVGRSFQGNRNLK